MRKFTTTIIAIILVFAFGQLQAQPEGINYQAVARDGSGQLMTSASIDVQFTVLEGAGLTAVYKETQSVSTNVYGLFTAVIGNGTASVGTFSGIKWGGDEHHLKVEVDAGSGFVDMGTTQLVSVPYSLYGKKAAEAGMINMFESGTSNPDKMIIAHSPAFPNWGLEYTDTTDMMHFRSNVGRNITFVISPGRIGIQNDDPTYELDVNGTTRTNNLYVNEKIGIGTTSPINDLLIDQSGGNLTDQQTGGLDLQNGTTNWRIYNSATANSYLRFNYSASGQTYTAKAYVANLDGSWNQQSDASVKKDVEPMENVLRKVLDLKPLKYHYLDNPADTKKSMGFFAQEVQKLFPEMVSQESEDAILGMDYSKFGVIAIKAIQEQQEIIKNLEERITELENK